MKKIKFNPVRILCRFKRTIFFIAVLFMICIPVSLYGEGAFLEPPAINFDITSFFSNEMYGLLNFLGAKEHSSGDYNKFGSYAFTHYFSLFFESSDFGDFRQSDYNINDEQMRINLFNAFNFRIKSFWLSLFFSIAGGDSNYIFDPEGKYFRGPFNGYQNGLKYTASQNSGFLGAGGAYKSDRFHIGAYLGIKTGESNIKYETMEELIYYWGLHDYSVYNIVAEKTAEKMAESNIYYTLIPVYYPRNLFFIEKIAALLNMNVYKPSEFFMDIPLRKFSPGGWDMSAGFYYYHEIYDPVANCNVYGMRAWSYLLPYKNNMKFTLDMGYRQFVDIKYSFDSFYHNTFYIQPSLQYNFKKFFIRASTLFDNKNFPTPTVDISAGFINNRFVTPARLYVPTAGDGESRRLGMGYKLLYGLFPY